MKLSIDTARGMAAQRGGICLSTEYSNNKTPLEWRCAAGHEWRACLKRVRERGHWCPICAGNRPRTLDEARAVAEARNGKCLSDSYENAASPLAWRCAAGHEWNAPLARIKNKKAWCPHCPAGRPQRTFEQMRQLAASRGGDYVSGRYQNAQSRLTWECHRGHTWEATAHSVLYLKTWCPRCRFRAREAHCRSVAAELLGAREASAQRPAFLKTEASPRGLELDIYYPELGVAIEVQGEQHRTKVPFFHPTQEAFDAQLRRDTIKRDLCFDNWVVLIEIWPEDNVRTVLTRKFIELGLMAREK